LGRILIPEINGSRPITARRSRAEIESIRDAIVQVLRAEHPATVRQVFYQLVPLGLIAKTEAEYKHTVGRLLVEMRLDGTVPFGWIADNTRWMRKPRTFGSLQAALELTVGTYRRALWAEQDVYVEVWLEKDALAGVLYEVTADLDVPLMVTRGYPSLSFLADAAEVISAQSKPAHLYYFGDYDPSGMDISRVTESRLREFAPTAEIHFERVAVTPQQIAQWSLPTRPTKTTDTRSKGFGNESVEVDAIPPRRLRDLARRRIVEHIDPGVMERTRAIEQAERDTLESIARRLVRRKSSMPS